MTGMALMSVTMAPSISFQTTGPGLSCNAVVEGGIELAMQNRETRSRSLM